MPRTQRTSRGPNVLINLIGAAIFAGLMLTPGAQRLAKTGSDYLDTHPAVVMPLLVGLAAFVAAAIALQSLWGFTASAAIGALLGSVLFLGLYAPARYALPWFGPDTATCPTGQVARPDGTCAVVKPVKVKAPKTAPKTTSDNR